MAATYELIVPLISEATLLGQIPITLGPTYRIRTIVVEQLGAIAKSSPSTVIPPNEKCITATNLPAPPSDEEVQRLTCSASFALNFFRKEGSALFGSAFILKRDRTLKVSQVIPLELPAGFALEKFRLTKNVKPSEIDVVFSAVENATAKHTKFLHCLNRFNAALARHHPDDKLIDIAICLESVVGTTSEVTFKFSLHNSLLAEDDKTKRSQIYELLKQLYKERSNVVHGNSPLDTTWFSAKWEEITNIGKLSIIKKASFLKDNNHKEWPKHLESLALGV